MVSNSILLALGVMVWMSGAIYLLIDTRKKVRNLGEKFSISYPFQCVECQTIKPHFYAEYMQLVKKPRIKLATFKTQRNQYLFYCDQCNQNQYQEILYQQIPANSKFEKERRKIVLFFILKEIALAISITAILGLTGTIPQ